MTRFVHLLPSQEFLNSFVLCQYALEARNQLLPFSPGCEAPHPRGKQHYVEKNAFIGLGRCLSS